MKKGLFIVFDGIDGSGKTENVKRTFQYLLEKDKKYDAILFTREPTNRAYGQKARKLQLTDDDPFTNAKKCLELYVADRVDHTENVIKPALEQNTIVLCDRYKYVTYAYQLVQGNKFEVIDRLHKGVLKPDLIFIFDLPVETAMMRIKGALDSKSIDYRDPHTIITRNSKENGRVKKEKFEDIKFLRESRNTFLKMKEFFSDENIIVINASQSKDKVFNEVKKHLDKFLS